MFQAPVCLVLAIGLVSGLPHIPKQSHPRLDGRIVGGHPVSIEDYPYQISLLYSNSHICGGSLISSNTVVTAGHCTAGFSESNLKVRAGSSIRNQGGRVVNIQEIIRNPQFNSGTLDFDISILILSEDLNPSSTIGYIALPEANQEVENGADAICTGWGTLTEGGSLPSRLQAVDLPIVGRDLCNVDYAGDITPRMICAGLRGVGGKDACQGDSGGPLVVNDELVGIVSWGYGCARPEYPGVYGSVPALRDFITEQTGI